ncbi:hypothetical protein [Mucilaginibacter glaciei]|uniref:Uncharacterized protein n=1 Tax=Mucilaginibacter glaciei TaxID=2772109 RepID=A0A926S0H1_9SPHI|nr:hypothetical protein [Mucilaginibacter glaciei]MBD1392003.1 hypothetical protein [Mucilaginibacter glaciei]
MGMHHRLRFDYQTLVKLNFAFIVPANGGHFLPLVFFPAETFNHSIFIPTLLGQYIIKNIVLMSGGIVIGATVRGGLLTAKPSPKLRYSGFKNILSRDTLLSKQPNEAI